DLPGLLPGDHLVFIDDGDFLVVHARGDRVPADAAANRLAQAALDFLALVDRSLGDPLRGAAILRGDDHVLGDVGELAGEVAGVGGLEGGVGQALAGAVRRGEILQDAQALAEVGLDRRLDDLAGRLGHQAAHTGQLADLLDAAAGAGVGHQEDRVEIGDAAAD